jgi:hypothetical protein
VDLVELQRQAVSLSQPDITGQLVEMEEAAQLECKQDRRTQPSIEEAMAAAAAVA